jgi:hypothetical protein
VLWGRKMGMITSVRAPVPVAEVPLQPNPAEARSTVARNDAAGPVAATMLVQATQQVGAKRASNDPELLAARMTAETPATAAAEAAKEAYIRASIAAGINPLPLP